MSELDINTLKQIVERAPDDFKVEFKDGEDTYKVSDKIQINVSEKKIIFTKY